MADGTHVHVPGPPGKPNMAQTGTLNLNNEVVKMRKEVKRIRVLVIRKLVRSVARLKSKKGSEEAVQKNQRRAQRLLEEIHAMKELKPDIITRSALGDDIDFEKTCKKPDSTASERAIARLAGHPLLKTKIDMLKAAVKTFKDARQNDTGVKSSKSVSEEDQSQDTLCSNSDASTLHHEGNVSEQKDKKAKILTKKPANRSKEAITKMGSVPKVVDTPDSLSNPSEKNSLLSSGSQKASAHPKMKTLNRAKTKKEPDSSPSDNSDGEELHEEEKEYFDDSTEERFYKLSSMSEDSDSGDDFFLGKVKRTRKKESSSHPSVKEQKKSPELFPKENIVETHQDFKNDMNKASTELRKFESVFFNSLSGTNNSRRNSREQAPKSKTPDFQQNEPEIKSQLNKKTPKRFQNSRQQSQLPLHPSWEASRKRKEQQSKIAVFQGKKITFDD